MANSNNQPQQTALTRKLRNETVQPPHGGSSDELKVNQLNSTQSGKYKKDKTAELVIELDKLAIQDTLRLHECGAISIPQEVFARRGLTSKYELIELEGAIYEPTLRYRVSFNDKEVHLPSKNAAKSTVDVSELNATSNCIGWGDSSTAYPEEVVGNPIGWLQELCMSRHWPPPIYEMEMELGLPHERLFAIACTIFNYREVGKGNSKKLAKRAAANNMWARLQKNPIDKALLTEAFRTKACNENHNLLNYYDDLKDLQVPTITTQHSHIITQFHNTMKNPAGEKIAKLQKTCLKSSSFNHMQLLADIAKENQFEVTYVDIEEKNVSGQWQCLVQLCTLPVAICHGFGNTQLDAQRNAAQNALEYLKIMTKKIIK